MCHLTTPTTYVSLDACHVASMCHFGSTWVNVLTNRKLPRDTFCHINTLPHPYLQGSTTSSRSCGGSYGRPARCQFWKPLGQGAELPTSNKLPRGILCHVSSFIYVDGIGGYEGAISSHLPQYGPLYVFHVASTCHFGSPWVKEPTNLKLPRGIFCRVVIHTRPPTRSPRFDLGPVRRSTVSVPRASSLPYDLRVKW